MKMKKDNLTNNSKNTTANILIINKVIQNPYQKNIIIYNDKRAKTPDMKPLNKTFNEPSKTNDSFMSRK